MKSLTFCVLLACKTSAPPIPDTPPTSTPAPVPVPAAVEAEQVTLTLNPDELRYDEAAGTATFSPGSGVRSASYTHYILDLASLEAALGGRPAEPVAVIVEITGEAERVHSPSDPNMPQPEGGFQITERTGRVVSRAP